MENIHLRDTRKKGFLVLAESAPTVSQETGEKKERQKRGSRVGKREELRQGKARGVRNEKEACRRVESEEALRADGKREVCLSV